MKENVSVFLDESGKDKSQISLIGSVLIPNTIYFSSSIKELNERLQNKSVKYHLTEYKNHHLENYIELFEIMLEHVSSLKFNTVVFKRNRFSNHRLKKKIDDMVYSKIPERVLYGALRGYSSFTEVEADIFIEFAEEYKTRNLDTLLKKQLNTHSLYRYDNFSVNNVQLRGKNEQIGIEFTDVCLGILSLILHNNNIVTYDNLNNSKFSTNLAYKKRLVFILLERFPDFFANIDLFELDDRGVLEKVEIDKYIKLFIAKYFQELEKHEKFNKIVNYKAPVIKRPRKYTKSSSNRGYSKKN